MQIEKPAAKQLRNRYAYSVARARGPSQQRKRSKQRKQRKQRKQSQQGKQSKQSKQAKKASNASKASKQRKQAMRATQASQESNQRKQRMQRKRRNRSKGCKRSTQSKQSKQSRAIGSRAETLKAVLVRGWNTSLQRKAAQAKHCNASGAKARRAIEGSCDGRTHTQSQSFGI